MALLQPRLIPPTSWGPVSRSYREWIAERNVRWDWFLTGTFREPVSERSAGKALMRWLRRINRRAFPGREGHRRLVRAVMSVELHRSGAPHVHAVVADVAHISRREALDGWKRQFGVVAELEPYDPARGGVAYVVKTADVGANIFVSREVFTER